MSESPVDSPDSDENGARDRRDTRGTENADAHNADARAPALFRAFPELRGRLPWLALGDFPTPVERVRGLVPDAVELWVKRDDQTGTLYGGNKVRKLEFLLGAARAAGVSRLATLGAYGSNHVLATAIYGRACGFAVEAVVFPQPITEQVRTQLLVDMASGATLRPTRGYLGVPWAVWRSRRAVGPGWIAPGGSSALGTLGYVSAGLELIEQIGAGALPVPDVVYVALGSGGTSAGLAVGLRGAAGWPGVACELVGVRVVDRLVSNARAVRRLGRAAEALLARHGATLASTPGPRLRVEHGFFGGAYGRATTAAREAVSRAAAVGLRLEPTYTGKTLAALLADAASGRLDGKRVLFIDSFSSAVLPPHPRQLERLPPLLRRLFPPTDAA